MAAITYNSSSSLQNNLITFTDIPNILKVKDASGGTKASMTLTFMSNLNSITSGDSQWYIAILGETITNVVNPSNAINKNFFVSSGNTSTAASVARALRNCPTLSAIFSIRNIGDSVMLTAKDNGSIWSSMENYVDDNIPSTYLSILATDGTSASNLNGAKIDVDIYADGSYVTTLEKNYYGSEVAFNLSPVFTTLAEYGKTKPYTLNVSSIASNGDYSTIGRVDIGHISIGYMVNQGYKYLTANGLNLAQNVARGESRDLTNNMLLYVYQPKIDFSVYGNATNVSGKTIQVKYLDSAYNEISAFTATYNINNEPSKLYDIQVNLTWMSEAFKKAFYIDVYFDSIHLRYNVIKPIKATEYFQRIYWRNSYGGVSFFDFTGQKSETRDLSISTYEKNIFDYYDNPMNELEKVYNNEVKYSVTLKSHLFENDGKYIFNDLLQSANVWTEINGQNYAIIIESISVDETDNNNVYEATLKYRYSQEPSLI